jgi:C4-dicarboxylate-specific signal transduction histidine kinase
LNQWNPYGKHLQLQESVYVHPLAAQLDEHWYDTLRLFDHQHNMCHCNSGLHGQKGPRHHQNSAAKNMYRSARGQKLPHTKHTAHSLISGKKPREERNEQSKYWACTKICIVPVIATLLRVYYYCSWLLAEEE